MIERALEHEFKSIELAMGDVIIETSTNNVGFLVKRTRRIDMAYDDIYFWEIKWTDDDTVDKFKDFPQANFLEEDYLKMSIIVGIIKWQSIKGETFEL